METIELVNRLFKRNLTDAGCLEDCFQSIRILEKENFEEAHRRNKQIRKIAGTEAKKQMSSKMLDIYKRTLLFDALYDLDSAIQYAEWDRPQKKKFYIPRRKQLLPIIKAMQRLEERKIRILGVMAPPGCGKSTCEFMFLCWTSIKHPELSSLMGSHSNSFLRGAYDEINRMLDPKGEYLWHEIDQSVKVVRTNAQDMRIDLGSRKRFETIEFSSIGSGNAGKVRCSNVLVADDLVADIESAMSKERMDKLWQQYYTDMMQRMIGDCAQLLVQTPWSLHDPIDRIEQMNTENPLAEFIHLPALDENDESNFDYPYGLGYTTEQLHRQRDIMDDASWRALYMTVPIEREGNLYDINVLRRYFELPDFEPDAVLAVCDTKDRGSDYLVLPVFYKYGQDFYVEDIVYSNGDEKMLEDLVSNALIKYKVQMCQFESNAAGGKIADVVQEKIKERSGITKITKKWTTANKETKIIVNSPYVIDHFLFKDESVIKTNKMYRAAINSMCSYTLTGRNRNDDAVDAMAMAALYLQSLESAKIEVIRRPV